MLRYLDHIKGYQIDWGWGSVKVLVLESLKAVPKSFGSYPCIETQTEHTTCLEIDPCLGQAPDTPQFLGGALPGYHPKK